MGQTKLSALPQSPPDAQAIAVSWLATFSKSLEAGDVDGVISTFFPDGYLRDILIFTWNNRTAKGHTAIRAFLASSLHAAHITNVVLDERQYFNPVYGAIGPSISGVSTGFTFETPIAKGQGYAKLAEDENGEWKALSVFFMMDELKGHGDLYPESGVYGGHTLAWSLVKEQRQRKIESDPHVIIVGAGQTGLNIGARLKQAGIPTLIIEKHSRVGDNWRKRYSTLTLHSPKPHTAMNFQDFPETWPTFTPRDKQADWLEQYAVSQDLVVWTQSTLQPVPKYDPDTGRWTCIVTRGDKSLLLRPAHIIVACGTIGAPNIPPVPSALVFEGKILHASSYDDGAPYAGKRVIVVGAGNTSADVCQDLVFHGAKSVTMVQRGVTTIVSCEKMSRMLQGNWPLDVPTAVSDFKYSSMPWGLMREFARESSKKRDPDDMDTAMLEKLEAKGFKLGNGPKDNSGQVFLVFERFGGYWLDVGVADLIHEGKVMVKSGVEVSQFTPKSVVYSDGSEQEADVVIFATGYKSVLESLKPLFGDEVVGKTELWGFDDEEELKGCYRPSGQPGLWYGAGNFYVSRFYSKQLALEIKAIELGYMKQ